MNKPSCALAKLTVRVAFRRKDIARVKEGIHESWCDNPTGLFINSCRSGAKGKNVVTSDVSAWFEWAKKQRIALAMSQGLVYTHDGDAVELQEMMRRYPLELKE
jgi:hypothetical protein